MGLTPKQERNGITADAGSQNSAQTGPIPAVPIGAAEAAGNDRWNEGHDLMATPQGSGTGGHTVGSGGNMWEWDAGLAIAEMPGEA